MKKIITIAMFALLIVNSSCVSYYTHRNWKEAQAKKAVRVEADGQAVMVGVDLNSMTYLKDNWPVALGAGVIDAVAIYYTYDWIDGLNEDSSSRDQRNTTVNVNGNEESAININISGDTTVDTDSRNNDSGNTYY